MNFRDPASSACTGARGLNRYQDCRLEWLIYDADTTCSLRYVYPPGEPRAIVRAFWREDHVREWQPTDGSRSTDSQTIMRQLRYSRRVDCPEHTVRSTGAAIQELYDRRGMGRGASMTRA
jgi:hypothetical protein